MLKIIVAKFQGVMGQSISQPSAVAAVTRWSSRPSHELIFDSGRREISQYMQAVDRLHQPPQTAEFKKLIAAAMARLKLEFFEVLKRHADGQAALTTTTAMGCSSVTDSTAYAFRYDEYSAPEPPSDDVVTYLRSIAERMNYSRRIGDCVEAYKSLRKPFLQALLKRLRFEELSIGSGYDPRRYKLDELRMKIEVWVQLSKICVKILFFREKQLCHRIFEGIDDNSDSAKDECFVATVKDFAVGLFAFVESMSFSDQSFDRMAVLLPLYDAFVWVLQDALALFDSKPGKGIRDSCLKILSGIENQVGKMLYDFENTVLHEIEGSDSVVRGEVSRSTVYVMDQISVIVKSKNSITGLIKSSPSLVFRDLTVSQDALGDAFSNHTSFLQQHIILILVVLQLNLKRKSESLKNPYLSHLFMMNNLRYMVRKIQESNELTYMISDSYLSKLNDNVEVAMSSYLTLTCSKFLSCFQDKGLYSSCCFKSRPLKSAVRKRLKAFNAAFEEINGMRSVWTVPDVELGYEVCRFMSEKLVPAYRSFLELFNNDNDTKFVVEKSVKYSPADFEELLRSLFRESAAAV